MISEKAKKKMAAVHAQARINADSNTDEQALAVPCLYPERSDIEENTKLEAGQRVNHEEILYNVIQSHKKQADWAPNATPSLYAKVLIPEDGTVTDWEQPDSTNGYKTGDRVTHNEKTWESLVDNNVWEPGAVGTESLWLDVTE